MYENTPRVRCTIHTRTQHTHNSFYTDIMLQQDLIIVSFCVFQHNFRSNKWAKNRGTGGFLWNKRKKSRTRYPSNEINVFFPKNLGSTSYTSWAATSLRCCLSVSMSASQVSGCLRPRAAVPSPHYKPSFFKTRWKKNHQRVWQRECTT